MTFKEFQAMAKKFAQTMNEMTPGGLKDIYAEQLKELLAEQVAIEAQEMAVKNPAPNFSTWPPEMPERPCPWRLDEELQKYRLRVPEPCDFKGEIVRYIHETKPNWAALFSDDPPAFEPMKTGDFRRIRICENGGSYYAWSADGKTPIFPIPMEEQ